MDMKKLIESMDRIEECGITEMPAMPASLPAPEMDRGNPVTLNVSMNASGKEHVADLLDMMKNAGLGAAEPVSAKILSPRMDMERLSSIMNGAMNEPEMEAGGYDSNSHPQSKDYGPGEEEDDEEDEIEVEEGKDGKALKKAEDYLVYMSDVLTDQERYDLSHEFHELAYKLDDIGIGGVMKEIKRRADETGSKWWKGVSKEFQNKFGKFAEGFDVEGDYANEPDPQYGDMSDAIPDGNDLNRKKKSYAAAQDGDNPMAVEAIKAQLMAALQEKKAKPDFLDIDGDGDRKEPMKKAAADKKKAGGDDKGADKGMSDKQAKYFGKKKTVKESFNLDKFVNGNKPNFEVDEYTDDWDAATKEFIVRVKKSGHRVTSIDDSADPVIVAMNSDTPVAWYDFENTQGYIKPSMGESYKTKKKTVKESKA